MCLESDTTHRARKTELRQIARLALQRAYERSAHDDRPDSRQLDAIRGAERSLDEGCRVRTVFDEYRERFDGKTGLRQRFEPSLRPRQILKHSDCESFNVGPHHGGNVSR